MRSLFDFESGAAGIDVRDECDVASSVCDILSLGLDFFVYSPPFLQHNDCWRLVCGLTRPLFGMELLGFERCLGLAVLDLDFLVASLAFGWSLHHSDNSFLKYLS